MFGARWSDDAGRSTIASDPAWARMFRWQKNLVDWFGHADLLECPADAVRIVSAFFREQL